MSQPVGHCPNASNTDKHGALASSPAGVTLSVRKCSLLPSLSLPRCSLEPFPGVLALDPREKTQRKTMSSHEHLVLLCVIAAEWGSVPSHPAPTWTRLALSMSGQVLAPAEMLPTSTRVPLVPFWGAAAQPAPLPVQPCSQHRFPLRTSVLSLVDTVQPRRRRGTAALPQPRFGAGRGRRCPGSPPGPGTARGCGRLGAWPGRAAANGRRPR